MEYYLNTYASGSEYLIAICDADVVGRTFRHKGMPIKIDPQFYGTNLYTKEEVMQEIIKSSSINAMGTNICDLLIENGLTFPSMILWFQDGKKPIGHVIVIK